MFEVEEGEFYSAEDADRATSKNYLYQELLEEPDCRVERLPDTLASILRMCVVSCVHLCIKACPTNKRKRSL